MQATTFFKYQGTGNDFIMLDQRNQQRNFNQAQIAALCHRRFGIGADGLIILRGHQKYDFEMVYYNSDGAQSSMCGNGGRCIARFAADLGMGREFHFLAIDGAHRASIEDENVSLQMQENLRVERRGPAWYSDTGSPHHVVFHPDPESVDLIPEARAIRYSEKYRDKGVNVNFVKVEDQSLYMRTYERGVEDETFSCGTGVTAAALCAHAAGLVAKEKIEVQTRGGRLALRFSPQPDGLYQNIWLDGPAEYVFRGEIEIPK